MVTRGALVKDWLPGFLDRQWPAWFHQPWPGRDSPEGRQEWSRWMTDLIEAKALQPEAELASARIAERGTVLSSGGAYLMAMTAEIGIIRQTGAMAAPVPPALTSREQAAQDSINYPDCHCGGSGMVQVFHPLYNGSAMRSVWVAEPRSQTGRRLVNVPARVPAHCVCPLGRWMRANTDQVLIQRRDDRQPRIQDLAEVRAGVPPWQEQDPTEDQRWA